jgi:hypothetical protein
VLVVVVGLEVAEDENWELVGTMCNICFTKTAATILRHGN